MRILEMILSTLLRRLIGRNSLNLEPLFFLEQKQCSKVKLRELTITMIKGLKGFNNITSEKWSIVLVESQIDTIWTWDFISTQARDRRPYLFFRKQLVQSSKDRTPKSKGSSNQFAWGNLVPEKRKVEDSENLELLLGGHGGLISMRDIVIVHLRASYTMDEIGGIISFLIHLR